MGLELLTLGARKRDKAFVVAMLAGFPALQDYLSIDDTAGQIIVKPYLFAGSGATFVIQAFLSLHHREPMVLQDIVHLDPNNRLVFVAALAVWLEG